MWWYGEGGVSRGWLQYDAETGVMSRSVCCQDAEDKNINNLYMFGKVF